MLIIKKGCIFAVLKFLATIISNPKSFPMTTSTRASIYILWIALLTLFANPVQAQSDTIVRAYVYTSNVKVGSTVDMYVRVDNFKSILGAQFSVRWNPAILQYVSVGNYNLSGLGVTNFGEYGEAVQKGILRFSWYDSNITGATLPNGAHLFSMKCKVIGQLTDTTEVIISGTPVDVEFVGVKKILKYDVSKKAVFTVANSTAQSDLDKPSVFQVNEVSPNPFQDQTSIRFTVSTAEQVSIKIYDLLGHEIKNITNFYNIGTHLVNIGQDVIPTSGTYIYQISTADTQYSGSIVKF